MDKRGKTWRTGVGEEGREKEKMRGRFAPTAIFKSRRLWGPQAGRSVSEATCW